jgi:hypothetical protein
MLFPHPLPLSKMRGVIARSEATWQSTHEARAETNLFVFAEQEGERQSQSRIFSCKHKDTKEITNEYSGLPRRYAPRNDVRIKEMTKTVNK